MKKKYLWLVLLFNSWVLLVSGQTLEFSTGLSVEQFIKVQDNNEVYPVDFNHNFGYCLALTGTLFSVYGYPVNSSVRYDHYHVDLYTGSDYTGMGGGSSTRADISRSVVGLALYPWNFSFRKKLHFSFGPEVGFKIHSKTDGEKSWWRMGQQSHSWHIENDSMKINRDFFAGITLSAGYYFPVGDNTSLSSTIRIYYGLTDEFKNLQSQLRMIRFSLEMGIAGKPWRSTLKTSKKQSSEFRK